MGKRRERGRKKGKSDGLGGPGLIIKGDSRPPCNELGAGTVVVVLCGVINHISRQKGKKKDYYHDEYEHVRL